MFAKAYVRQIGDNVSRSIAEAIKRGEFRANAPLGYSYVQTDQRLVQNEKAPLVKQMFELYATGRYSLETLADTMRKKGLREKKRRITITGKKVDRGEMPISSMTVWYVLQNLFYTSRSLERSRGRDERILVEGKNYEPLISRELFDKVQKVLALNNQKKNDQARNPTQAYYKFRKMIKCGWCGCSLTPENMAQNFKNQKSAGAQVNYYHCSSGKAITSDPDYYVREFGHDHSGVRVAVHGKIQRSAGHLLSPEVVERV